MKLKDTVLVGDILKVSMSAQGDYTVAFNLQRNGQDRKKGDYMFVVERLVEFVTRVVVAFRKITGKNLDVTIADAFMVTIDTKGSTRVSFDRDGSDKVRLSCGAACCAHA